MWILKVLVKKTTIQFIFPKFREWFEMQHQVRPLKRCSRNVHLCNKMTSIFKHGEKCEEKGCFPNFRGGKLVLKTVLYYWICLEYWEYKGKVLEPCAPVSFDPFSEFVCKKLSPLPSFCLDIKITCPVLDILPNKFCYCRSLSILRAIVFKC